MKRKTLLTLLSCSFIFTTYAQKNQKISAYAITGAQKGQNNWSEVRLVDITTGDEIKTIYQNKQQAEILNARTGKAVVKKEVTKSDLDNIVIEAVPGVRMMQKDVVATKTQLDPSGNVRIIPRNNANNVNTVNKVNTNNNVNVVTNINTTVNVTDKVMMERKVYAVARSLDTYNPFATNSAACAYDKKHDRLYYTPMSINQLRYIDLKSNKIYYFEDEPFGALKNPRDVSNQVTRMVFGSDGNGYALTNDANHLIRFTTGKNTVITDLGMINDDPANGNFSVHNAGGYGGDIIADAQKNIYLVTANHNVFKISLENKTALYVGAIKGLPKGYTTNGAMVEGGSSVIVCSSNSTQGYYRFDLNSLQSEKITGEATVYNASDLANGILAFDKKKKDRKNEVKPTEVIPEPQAQPASPDVVEKAKRLDNVTEVGNISVFPNPVRNGVVKVSFENQPRGRYQVQFMDISGKIISTREVTIDNSVQVQEISIPKLVTAGNYLVKVVNDAGKTTSVNKLVVEQ